MKHVRIKDTIRYEYSESKWAVYEVTGIYLGGENQEGTIGLKRLDIAQSNNEVMIPYVLLNEFEVDKKGDNDQ